MRISSRLGYGDGFLETVERVVRLEEVGLDVLWVPEVYGDDAATRLGYLAARTRRVQLASGIFPIYSRTPALLAMTAAGLDDISNGRAILGLGPLVRRSSRAGTGSRSIVRSPARARSSTSVA